MLQDLVFDNACLAHLRKRRAEEGAAAASNGVDADPERGQQHTVTVEADNHIGMAYREEQCSSGIDGMNVLAVENGRGVTYVHERRQ